MKIGRLILTYRQDLILPIKDFYLGGNRTEFLVIAYNQETVEAAQFETLENFKLEPYMGKGEGGNITGQQFLVWVEVIKKYPEIEAWVIHDYDLLAKPTDKNIFSHLKVGEYAGFGKPFPNWQEGMQGETTSDIFPYPYHYVSQGAQKDTNFLDVEKILVENFPVSFQGVPTIMTGYSDFLAAWRKDILLLDNPYVHQVKETGIDQVVPTVFSHYKIHHADLRQFFSVNISLDNDLYLPFENKFDFSHPVKFWPV